MLTLGTDEIIQKKITMLMALTFVLSGDVADAFMQIFEDENFPENLQPIMYYFEDTYIGRQQRNRRRNSFFPPNMWNVREGPLMVFQGQITCWKLGTE